MKDKKYIITLLNCYVDNLSNDLKARWNNWNKNFNEKEIHEVLGGLLARQISITIELARNPSIWNSNVAPMILRSMIDNYINFCWILLSPLERSQKYIYFGLGQDKLQLEHFKSNRDNFNKDEIDFLIKDLENWINSQQYEFLTVVNVGNWAEKSVRDMSIETDNLELYNNLYQTFSSVTHNMWNHVAKHNLILSDNPLHNNFRKPIVNLYQPNFFFMELAMKYTDLMFVKFDEKFDINIDIDSSKNIFDKSLNDYLEKYN